MPSQEDIYIVVKVPGDKLHESYMLPYHGENGKEMEARARAHLQLDGWMSNPRNVLRVDDWHIEFIYPEGTKRIENPFSIQPRRKAKPKPPPQDQSGAD